MARSPQKPPSNKDTQALYSELEAYFQPARIKPADMCSDCGGTIAGIEHRLAETPSP